MKAPSFNPIAPTFLRKALQALLAMHFAPEPSKRKGKAARTRMPSSELLDRVVASANGDIRSAVMALQFACVMPAPVARRGTGSGGVALDTGVREQSLALFHMLGKVLYNKRKCPAWRVLYKLNYQGREGRCSKFVCDQGRHETGARP